MNINNLASIITDNSISIYTEGKDYCISSDNINYAKVKSALNEKRFEQAIRLCDPSKVIEECSNDNLTVKDGVAYYKGDRVDEQLQTRLIELLQDGHTNLDSYYKFLENVYANPSRNSREQLYRFIAHRGLPIVSDGEHAGCIIGYKGVSSDYTDKYSHKYDNRPGVSHEMPRRDVDDNPDSSCSYGFHIGSKDYADDWAGHDGHLMAVVWNPADAVSVPYDCNGQKLRVCKYTVLSEITNRKGYLDGTMYTITDGKPQQLQSDGIIEQKYSDEYYKARNYLETARDNHNDYINEDELRSKFSLTDDEFDALLDECDAYLEHTTDIWLQ